jgi:hypothetical protein
MRIRRALIAPAILVLSVTGSLFAGSAMPMAAGQTPPVHVWAMSGGPGVVVWA